MKNVLIFVTVVHGSRPRAHHLHEIGDLAEVEVDRFLTLMVCYLNCSATLKVSAGVAVFSVLDITELVGLVLEPMVLLVLII